jgi:hypothetical protein
VGKSAETFNVMADTKQQLIFKGVKFKGKSDKSLLTSLSQLTTVIKQETLFYFHRTFLNISTVLLQPNALILFKEH